MQFSKMSTILVVQDVSQSARFYADLLGFEVAFDIGWIATMRHASGSTIDLWQRSHESVPPHLQQNGGGPVLAFVGGDAKSELARVLEAGAEVTKPLVDNPWGQRNFMFQDPDGTTIDIVELIAPDPAFLREHGLG